MDFQLSQGVLKEIFAGGNPNQPVVQVLGIKKVNSHSGDRFRLLLSDGVYSQSSAMLASQLNGEATNGGIPKNCVMRIDKYLCNSLPDNKRVMILLGFTVLSTQVTEMIGTPQQLSPTGQLQSGPQNTSNGGNQDQNQSVQQNRPPQSNRFHPYQNNAPTSGPNTSPTGRVMGSGGGNTGTGANQVAPRTPLMAKNTSLLLKTSNTTPGGTVIHPIDALNPYQSKWTIRGRVTKKSSMRTWSNSRGDGKLFNLELMDDTGEIRMTCFNEQADQFYDKMEVNKVYVISHAQVKPSNKQYTTIKHDYEIRFTSMTTVEPCDDDPSLPSVTYTFRGIAELPNIPPESFIDIIGVCKLSSDLSVVMTRATNRELTKRELTLVDDSNTEVNLTLWGQDAQSFASEGSPIVLIKSARVSDFGGRSLSLTSAGDISINPDIPEAHRLRGWFDATGHTQQSNSVSNQRGSAGSMSCPVKHLGQVRDENLGLGDKPDYFSTKAVISFMRKENCLYKACANEKCNKKVIDESNGKYRCEKCNEVKDTFKYRCILSVSIADHTDTVWVTCFQESAEVILNENSETIGHYKDEDTPAFEAMFDKANFQPFIFKARAKMENYNEENRLKIQCVSVSKIDHKDYAKQLITSINEIVNTA